MEYIVAVIFIIALVLAYPRLSQNVRSIRYETILNVNIDSQETDEYQLPKKRVRMQKTALLCAPLSPNMRIEEIGLDSPRKVVESVVTEDLISVNLDTIIVPFSDVEDRVADLSRFGWNTIS